ncbi:thioredoxin [Candidatus Uhrbacteria bacterium]|nr:thioredoxin [Candidatus Uhrbacteria bacterium]
MENQFTDENFDTEVLKSNIPVLVDFWAPWCGPCRIMSPIVDELAETTDSTKLKIGKMNVDENGQTAMAFKIMSIPTFLVFQNGQVVDSIVGGMSKEEFVGKLAKYLA